MNGSSSLRPSPTSSEHGRREPAERLSWADTVKGISILWIVFFHGFIEFRGDGAYAWPLDPGFLTQTCPAPAGVASGMVCLLRAAVIAVSSVGFHAVGVFLVLSGFTLARSAARKGIGPLPAWYRGRVLRLFPLYWVAHLLYLLSPPPIRSEPIDYRFLLSFLGDRLIPLGEIFFYANAAWWYFGLLLQLYLVFPLLFAVQQRVGARNFLAAAAVVTLLSRYLVLIPFASEHSGALLLGALFTCRLFEFCVGLVLGVVYAADPNRWHDRLAHPLAGLAGLALYAAGVASYASKPAYVVTDACIGCGLALLLICIARASERLPRLEATMARVGAYSYGLYLFHQPYMIWVGGRLEGASLPSFLLVGGAATAVLCRLAMAIESRVNHQVSRWLG